MLPETAVGVLEDLFQAAESLGEQVVKSRQKYPMEMVVLLG